MIRKEAIKIISKIIKNQPIIAANGFISRDLFDCDDKPSNFYMIGSMGLASSIALGIALKKPKKKIYVFDGDGNILMNLGSLITIGAIKPKNLIHFVFDNHSHESTGGQPTNSSSVHIEKIAKAANYRIFKTSSKIGLKKIMHQIKKLDGPTMILVKIKISSIRSPRVALTPIVIKNRFMNQLNSKK